MGPTAIRHTCVVTGAQTTSSGRRSRFLAWLRVFVMGRGNGPVGFGCGSLILALVLAPAAAATYSLTGTAEWLSIVGKTSVSSACEARMLRLSELEVRVVIPEASGPVVLASPDLGVPLRWWPAGWENCAENSDYFAPVEVLHATRADGTTVAIATRDLPDLLDRSMFWIVASIVGLFATFAIAWAVISWFVADTPHSKVDGRKP